MQSGDSSRCWIGPPRAKTGAALSARPPTWARVRSSKRGRHGIRRLLSRSYVPATQAYPTGGQGHPKQRRGPDQAGPEGFLRAFPHTQEGRSGDEDQEKRDATRAPA